MVDFLVPPLSIPEIRDSLSTSKIRFLFETTRGQKPYNLEALADILFGLSQLAQEASDLKEFDINPLLIYNDGRKDTAVDVKIII
jgi:acetyltransferase